MSLSPTERQSDYNIQPFLEANWINNSKNYGVRMNDESAYIEGSRNLGEIKVGLEGSFNDNFSAWGSFDIVGSDSYRETKGVLGVKYRF